MTPTRALCLASLLAALAAMPAWGQTISFNGSLGSKAALLLIDGEPCTVVVGQQVHGFDVVLEPLCPIFGAGVPL